MAASITDVTKTGAISYRYQWSGTAPFDVYLYGNLFLAQTDDTSIDLSWDSVTDYHQAEAPAIEVIDSTQTNVALKQVLYPPNIELQFRGQSNASYYLIELSIDGGSTWLDEVVRIVEDGSGYYRFSIYLAEALTLDVRVSAYDSEDQQSDYMDFSVFHHPVPIAPHITLSYSSGTGEVTIDEA